VTLDAVGIEVHGARVASVAEEMGLVLVQSALSPNIRERRDASAALFDARGEMIAQAAHIPVHLARSRTPWRRCGRGAAPGERFLLNDPYAGGSHLPDLTLIEAIAVDGMVGGTAWSGPTISDVGGATPGSMPAGARELFAEGLVVPPLRLTPEVERLVLANVRTPECGAATSRPSARRWRARRRPARAGGALRWIELQAAARDLVAYAERRTRARVGTARCDGPHRHGLSRRRRCLGRRHRDHGARGREDGVLHADFAGRRPRPAGT